MSLLAKKMLLHLLADDAINYEDFVKMIDENFSSLMPLPRVESPKA